MAKAGLIDLDHLVNKFFREQHETLLDAKPRAMAALKRLAVQEYLQVRPVVMDAARTVGQGTPEAVGHFLNKHYMSLAFNITPRAARDFNAPLPPNIRTNFVTHHLKTMEAILQVERQFNGTGERVLDFKMESQLVRENFSGKVFRPGSGDIKTNFPDAMLVVRTPNGGREEVRVEYVSTKYTDKMIAEKAAAWTTGRTVWAAPNQSTADRIQRITGAQAVIV
ncbi:hypothetical protein D7Y04_41855 [Corallococcus sp. AB038B]|nr:hypothetical protein D7Y04_41855 [Corallococcus sp. AB038B]